MSAITDSMDLNPIDRSPTTLECLDYIPIISMVTGVARAVFGFFQAMYGIVAYPWEKSARILGDKSPFTFVEGIANIARGWLAYQNIVGNAILYQRTTKNSAVYGRDVSRPCGSS